MQGSWNNDQPYYRCMFLAQYAAKNKIRHPARSTCARARSCPASTTGSPDCSAPANYRAPTATSNKPRTTHPDDALTTQARREIADCDAKLRQHRAALEAAADPKIVAGWIPRQAQRATQASPAAAPRLTREEISQHLAAIRDVTKQNSPTAEPRRQSQPVRAARARD